MANRKPNIASIGNLLSAQNVANVPGVATEASNLACAVRCKCEAKCRKCTFCEGKQATVVSVGNVASKAKGCK